MFTGTIIYLNGRSRDQKLAVGRLVLTGRESLKGLKGGTTSEHCCKDEKKKIRRESMSNKRAMRSKLEQQSIEADLWKTCAKSKKENDCQKASEERGPRKG